MEGREPPPPAGADPAHPESADAPVPPARPDEDDATGAADQPDRPTEPGTPTGSDGDGGAEGGAANPNDDLGNATGELVQGAAKAAETAVDAGVGLVGQTVSALDHGIATASFDAHADAVHAGADGYRMPDAPSDTGQQSVQGARSGEWQDGDPPPAEAGTAGPDDPDDPSTEALADDPDLGSPPVDAPASEDGGDDGDVGIQETGEEEPEQEPLPTADEDTTDPDLEADDATAEAPAEVPAEGGEPSEEASERPWEALLTEEQVTERIGELASEGHAPGRHLDVSDEALQKRLGEVRYKDGNPVMYGPTSDYAGLFKGEKQIDPLTGSEQDGENPAKKHYCGPYSTRFDNAEDMVRADAYFRAKFDSPEKVEPTPIADILGPDAHRDFTGFYRDPANPDQFRSVDFEGGMIRPQYRVDEVTGEWKLHTMMIDPAPRRHP
ncbi:hypothetical protein [Streptomyces erythrochromogenes]|uniref:hypothetical protein n=1 Tax=Streptomyces erythrochromogenes TaxID=285574 RepID=UPI0002DBA52B